MDKLSRTDQDRSEHTAAKVSVVGVGQVGMAAVFAMLATRVSTNVVMIDNQINKLKGQMMDMQHGASFVKDAKVNSCTDYSKTVGSRVCVVTAGVRQRAGETRLDLVQRNTEVFKEVIPKLVKYSPEAILVIASNPVDILTYLTWKISGLPKHRVIGTGTNLDSARFRYLLAKKLNIAPTSCNGYIIGEHGDTSVAVWSSVNVAGVRLMALNKDIGTDKDPEKWYLIHKEVIDSAYEVIKLKGYTSTAIGLTISHIVHAILTDSNTVQPVSTYIKGEHGVKDEVFLSLPCVLGHNGVYNVIRQILSEKEHKQLVESAELMAKIISGIKL